MAERQPIASVFRQTYKRPVPNGAEIVTRKGQRLARWKDKHGKTQTAPLSADEKSIVLEYRCWYIAYTDSGGARKTVKGYTDKTATEAEAVRLEKEAAQRRSGLVTYDAKAVGKPLDEALKAWLTDLRRQGCSDAYVYNMRLLTRKLARECHWSTLGSIRSDALTEWMAAPGQAHLSGRSRNQYLDSARAFVNWCCSHNPPWLPANPLLGVEKADESKKRREKRALTLEELAKLKKVSGRRWVIYLTAALTGLRRSELQRLQWGDVHLDAAHPYIQLRAEATKAKRADVVSINPELLEALRAYRPVAAQSSDAVFPVVPKYATYRKDVETRAGIPWRDGQGRLASCHALRKTFGTYLALANVPLRVAMDMMRVTEADLLTDIYTDAKLLNTSAAAAMLPRIAKFDEDDDGNVAAAG